MSENIQKSSSLNQMVDSFTHLKQRLEYFRTLAQVIEAENALRNFAKVFYNDSDSNIKNSMPNAHFER